MGKKMSSPAEKTALEHFNEARAKGVEKHGPHGGSMGVLQAGWQEGCPEATHWWYTHDDYPGGYIVWWHHNRKVEWVETK